jgi:hypothetical protein
VGGSGINLSGQGNFAANTTLTIEPTLTAMAVTSTRASEHKIDMALEMLDVNSMDTGRYQAMVIQDASDKQAIKGFVKFAQVMASRSQGQLRSGGMEIDRLRDVLNEYTGLKADFLGMVTFDDPRLLEIPIILPQGRPNEAEMANLTKYLLTGGFVLGNVVDIYAEGLEKYGNLVRGKDFWTERLPEDHPIFSAFFDLRGGMPSGYAGGSLAQGKSGRMPWNFLTGHFVRGRMAGITPGDGGWGWMNDQGGGNSTRQLQLAVNIMIYALTQEGSITQRLMQMVN